jgi:stearoyl-CoA desaturase (delta-9 desaturase)
MPPSSSPPPLLWTTTLLFSLTFLAAITLIPWYGFTHGFSTAAWISAVIVVIFSEMAVTCGYHRLFAHASYEAHGVLKLGYLLFGAMSLQNSALLWGVGHRAHHRFVDDNDRDPYSAGRGFWFSHIGWMLRDYPSGVPDLALGRDLQRDPLIMWQHRNYLAIALSMNIALPLLLGWALGDVWGVFLLVGVLRLVVNHHFTFFINSLAHMWGTRPYNERNSARDNALLAVLTFGEGYHNFHHAFAQDFRNGVRWWHYDPSKWFIYSMSLCGLARGLRRTPWFRIQRARLDGQFAHAERQLAQRPQLAQFELLRQRVADEYHAFSKAVSEWNALREQWLDDTKRAVAARWDRSALQRQLREIESGLQQQIQRMRALQAQLG